jgi:hypothetical protein
MLGHIMLEISGEDPISTRDVRDLPSKHSFKTRKPSKPRTLTFRSDNRKQDPPRSLPKLISPVRHTMLGDIKAKRCVDVESESNET